MMAGAAVLVFAAVDLHVRGTGQRHIASLQQKIKKAEEDIARIHAGSAPTKATINKSQAEWGLEEMRNALHAHYTERGREWRNCIIRDIEEVTLPPALPQIRVRLIITGPPDASGIETDATSPEHLRGIVYAFNETNNGSTFLGRFSVDSGTIQTTKFSVDNGSGERDGYQITLISSDHLNSEEVTQIFDAGRARWAMYLTPPTDRVAGIFTQLTDDEKAMISAELLDRFQSRDMPELTDEEKQDVAPNVLAVWEKVRSGLDDPEAEWALDYAPALDWLYLWQGTLLRNIAATEVHIATNKFAEEKAKAENEKMTADCVLEEAGVARMEVQRDVVKGILEQYQEEVASMTLQTEKLQTLNEAFVAKIAEYQATAVESIEKRATNEVRSE